MAFVQFLDVYKRFEMLRGKPSVWVSVIWGGGYFVCGKSLDKIWEWLYNEEKEAV